jgi:hypothetical protein
MPELRISLKHDGYDIPSIFLGINADKGRYNLNFSGITPMEHKLTEELFGSHTCSARAPSTPYRKNRLGL